MQLCHRRGNRYEFFRSSGLILLMAFACAEAGTSALAASQAPGVASVTLTPSTIAGGSGASATGTVFLTAPAPTGAAIVSLASSNIELAATMPAVTVPQGATSASFTVATNPRYRAYSNLSFTVAI